MNAKSTSTDEPSENNVSAIWKLLNHISIDTKMRLADINPHLRQWIADNHMLPVLRIHQKTIRFEGTSLRDQPYEADHLIIRDIQTVRRFLKHFGHLITKMVLVGQSYHDTQTTEICHLIATHCSASLQEIDLRASGSYLISDTDVTFPNVLNVKLDYFNYTDNLQIHRIFPAMEQLTLEIDEVKTIEPGAHLDRNLANICHSVRFNEKLQSLNLRKPRVSMLDLQVINENLPNLVSLEVRAPILADIKYPVHFENVKNFTCSLLEGVGRDQTCPITFEHLEALTLNSILTKHTDLPFKLVQQNAAVQSLKMPLVGSEIASNELINHIEATHNLRGMEITWMVMRGRSEPLPNFSAFQRMKFVIRNGNDKMEERASVMKKLPSEWTIVEETKKDSRVSFENFSFITVERTVNMDTDTN